MKTNRLVALLLGALLLTTLVLGGCGKTDDAAKSDEPASSTVPTESTEPEAAVKRQDGERFETTITIEGMEETVRYEHVKNEDVGFEMDYDYEKFDRSGSSDVERFVSVWDDADAPENYFEVRYNPQDAETVAAAVDAALSGSYTTSRDDAFDLARAGKCIRIDASETKSGGEMPPQLQMVYIVPADDGCRVVTAHYAIESAEGFGRRFHYFMDTFEAIPCGGEKRISSEQALAAVTRYCMISNPELEEHVNAGEYRVSWGLVSEDADQIVVLFRSYTGAEIRYYIDPVSGETDVTEFVSGVMTEEQPAGETLNVWDYNF